MSASTPFSPSPRVGGPDDGVDGRSDHRTLGNGLTGSILSPSDKPSGEMCVLAGDALRQALEGSHVVDNEMTQDAVCIYCGERATGVDHLLPLGWVEGSHRLHFNRRLTLSNVPAVDCCLSCNCILGDKFIPNLVERVRFVGEALIRRRESDERIAFNARILYELRLERDND